MQHEDSEFKSVGELLPDAIERLFERVKQRKIEEFMEMLKNEKYKKNERT